MDKWEEYKFFAESTQFLTEKRLNASQTYLTVNTAIFAVIGFVVKDSGLSVTWFSIGTLPLILVAIIACTQWYRMINNYKALISWRYEQLMAMEDEMPDSYKMYKKEWDDFYKPQASKKRFGFSVIEKNLPLLILILYVLYGAAIIVVVILNK